MPSLLLWLLQVCLLQGHLESASAVTAHHESRADGAKSTAYSSATRPTSPQVVRAEQGFMSKQEKWPLAPGPALHFVTWYLKQWCWGLRIRKVSYE